MSPPSPRLSRHTRDSVGSGAEGGDVEQMMSFAVIGLSAVFSLVAGLLLIQTSLSVLFRALAARKLVASRAGVRIVPR